MASNALANEYRPRTFDEVVGHDRYVKGLKNLIKSDEVPPVILLAGTSGGGKSTLARVAAAALLCMHIDTAAMTPCGECMNCRSVRGIEDGPNFLFLDGTASTKATVEEKLTQFVRTATLNARYKAVLIDEAQALSGWCRDALLTLLENLPARSVVFLTTTDPEAIDIAILTRCFKMYLSPMTPDQLVEGVLRRMPELGTPEGRPALGLLAKAAEGSMREMWQFVHQWKGLEEHLTPEVAAFLAHQAPDAGREKLWGAIFKRHYQKVHTVWKELVEAGAEPNKLGDQMVEDLLAMSAERPDERDWGQAIQTLSRAQLIQKDVAWRAALCAIGPAPDAPASLLDTEFTISRIAEGVAALLPKPRTVEAVMFGESALQPYRDAYAATRPSSPTLTADVYESFFGATPAPPIVESHLDADGQLHLVADLSDPARVYTYLTGRPAVTR